MRTGLFRRVLPPFLLLVSCRSFSALPFLHLSSTSLVLCHPSHSQLNSVHGPFSLIGRDLHTGFPRGGASPSPFAPCQPGDLPQPTVSSTWAIPNSLIVGARPGKFSDLEEEIEGLLGSGVTTFLSLQQAKEVTPEIDYLPIVGDRAETRNFPIKDFAVLPDNELLVVIKASIVRIKCGGVLFIHCHGGTGRAGVLASCIIGILNGMKVRNLQLPHSPKTRYERAKGAL